jgi:hypothetical protein
VTARDRTVLMVVALIAALGAFWFLALSPKRKEATSLGAQITAAQDQLRVAQEGARTALQAKERYASDYATVARLGKAVPASDEVPSLLYQLETAAQESGVDFRSIRLEAQAASAATAAPPVAAAASVGNAEKGGAAPATPTQPVAATEAAAAVLPPGASIGPAGFPTMPFSFTFQGSFKNLQSFLDRLKRFTTVDGQTIRVRGRLLTINGVGLTAGPKGFPQMKAQIAATAYLLPADQAVVPQAQTAVPAAGATPSPSSPTPAASTGGTSVAPAATVTPGATR